MDFSKDNRGWKKGKGRKWEEKDIKRISEIHHQLNKDKNSFFVERRLYSRHGGNDIRQNPHL